MWRDRDTYLNPVKTVASFLAIAFAAALIITGLVGAIWGTVEVVKHITTWVL